MKQVFAGVEGAPEAIGPYSVAVANNDLIFTSGQLPIDTKTGTISGETAALQTKVAMDNLQAILLGVGSDLKNVLKVTIFLTDMSSFAEVNEVYSQYFKEQCPARTCVEVSGLPKGAYVEIEAVALR